MAGPIEASSKSLLPTPYSFRSDGFPILIPNISAVFTDTSNRTSLAIFNDLSAGPRKFATFEGSFIAVVAGELHSRAMGTSEGAAVGGDSEEDFVGRQGVWWAREVVDRCGAGWCMWLRWMRVQLRVMTCTLRPGAKEVVAHDVEVVEVSDALGERDMLQVPFGSRECGGEDVGMLWEELAD
jgi:hypothetical protein